MSVYLKIESCRECPFLTQGTDNRAKVGDTIKVSYKCPKKKGTHLIKECDLDNIPSWCPIKQGDVDNGFYKKPEELCDSYQKFDDRRLECIKQYGSELPTAYALSIKTKTNLAKIDSKKVKPELKEVIKILHNASKKGEFSVKLYDTEVPSNLTQHILKDFGYKVETDIGEDDISFCSVSWERAKKIKELY